MGLLTEKFLNLGVVSSGTVGSLHLDIIKVAESKHFGRHYSGYTQAAALAALVSSIIKPDIVISFGTAGGVTEKSKAEYGMGSQSKNESMKWEVEKQKEKEEEEQKEKNDSDSKSVDDED